jgi:DNA repair ATPase RecN
MKKILTKATATLAALGIVLTLSACGTTNPLSSTQEQVKTPLEQAQDYVTSLDSKSAEISKKADEYIEAVGKSDSVAAKLKLEEITKTLDECANLQVPDELKDEGEKYKSACNSLKDAVNSLNEVASSSSSTLDLANKVSEAQTKYDQAAKSLQEADKSLNDKLTELKKSK